MHDINYVKLADAYVGTPYQIHGRTPEAWDCYGCVYYLRKHLFGRSTPSLVDAYDAVDFKHPKSIAAVIDRHLGEWRETELKPGVALLFRILGANSHTGLYLENGQFIHALHGCETAIEPLQKWKGRLVAAYDTE